jgi:excisionase family DNA binding protein
MQDGHDRLLTTQEAGEFLGLKTSTIRRLTYARELPVVRPTGRRAVRHRLWDQEGLASLMSPGVQAVERQR